MKHALLSPSSAHRWLMCAGSIQANKDKPFTQSTYALEGTSAHTLLEVCLRSGADPDAFLGSVLEDGHMPVDQDMADAVGYALDYVKEYLALNPKASIRIEQPVYPAAQIGLAREVLWGTPDIQLDNYPKELVTIDYKHGTGIPVSVKDNPQIKLYHAGARQEHGRYRRYRAVVIQPRIPRRRPVQEHSITDAELVSWLEETVRPQAEAALSKNPPRKSGEWCRYCAADGKCPAQAEEQIARAQKEFSKKPDTLTPSQVAKYLDMLPALNVAIEGIVAYAIRLLHQEKVKVPGYEVAYTRTRRVWADEEKANTALAKLGLEKTERYEVSLLSPAKAEAVLRDKGLLPRKKRGQPPPPSPLDMLVAETEANPTYRKTER